MCKSLLLVILIIVASIAQDFVIEQIMQELQIQEGGTPLSRGTFVHYESLPEFPLQISLAGYATAILLSPTQAHYWGFNSGRYTMTFPEPMTTVECGGYNCLGLSETGLVYEWGQTQFGLALEPVPVPELPGKITKISAGFKHMAALTENGEVYTWGETINGKLGYESVSPYEDETIYFDLPHVVSGVPKIVDIRSGGDHTILLDEQGALWSFGRSHDGQLGRSTPESFDYTPLGVVGIDEPVVDFSADGDHTLVLTKSGKVYTFGWGERGQLGHGTKASSQKPTVIELPEGVVPTAVAAGGYGHSLVLTADGDVYSFGWNEFFQCGLASVENDVLEPTKIEEIQGAVKIFGGGFRHSAVLTKNQLVIFGDNEFGQLGPNHGTEEKLFPGAKPLPEYVNVYPPPSENETEPAVKNKDAERQEL